MTDDLPHSVWSGSFWIGDLEMKCHLLSDGQRIIETESMQRFLSGLGDEVTYEDHGADIIDFAKWVRGDDA